MSRTCQSQRRWVLSRPTFCGLSRRTDARRTWAPSRHRAARANSTRLSRARNSRCSSRRNRILRCARPAATSCSSTWPRRSRVRRRRSHRSPSALTTRTSRRSPATKSQSRPGWSVPVTPSPSRRPRVRASTQRQSSQRPRPSSTPLRPLRRARRARSANRHRSWPAKQRRRVRKPPRRHGGQSGCG